MNFYTYLYRDPRNSEPIYVGKGFGDRSHVHVQKGAKNPHFRRRIESIRRDGLEPLIEVIPALDEACALAEECRLILLYGRRDLGTGSLTNHTAGGEGMANPGPELRARISDGVKASLTPEKMRSIKEAQRAAITPELRARMSAIQKEIAQRPGRREQLSAQMRGRKASPEAKAKMSAAKKGIPKTPEHAAAIKAGLLGRKMPEGTRLAQAASWTDERRAQVAAMNKSRAGKKASDETRAKMSAAKKGVPKTPEHVAAIAAARVRNKAARLALLDVEPN